MNTRPNIVIITLHDAGRHFGCYGIPTVDTPAIDALAADGVKFTQMFATSSICSPSRGSLMTGRYPQSNGLFGLAGGCWGWSFNNIEEHLSHALRKSGYDTALFGLQHEACPDTRKDLGFDHDNLRGKEETRATQPIATGNAQDFADFVKARGQSDKPLYAQVGFFETHTPYDFRGTEPDDSKGVHIPAYTGKDESDAELVAHTAGLQGSLKTADNAVAIITQALRDTGMEDDTLILFNVDHGPELPKAKWTMTDAGLGIAFIVRWPGGGITGGKTFDWMLSNTDWVPTLRDMLELPDDAFPAPMDGVSFRAAFDDNPPADSPRDAVFGLFVNGQNYAARNARYKIIRNFAECKKMPKPGEHAPQAELYDLEKDPDEMQNVVDDPAYADAYREMSDLLWSWLEQVDDPILRGPVPTPTWQRASADYRDNYKAKV